MLLLKNTSWSLDLHFNKRCDRNLKDKLLIQLNKGILGIPISPKSLHRWPPLKDVIKAASAAANKSSGAATSSWAVFFEGKIRPGQQIQEFSPLWNMNARNFFLWNHDTRMMCFFLSLFGQSLCKSCFDFWHLEVGGYIMITIVIQGKIKDLGMNGWSKNPI